MQPVNIKIVAQSVERAALKTFAQAFVGVLAITLVPELNRVVTQVVQGHDAVIDWHFYENIGLAAVAAGIAAVVSLIWNMLHDSTPATVGLDTNPAASSTPVPAGSYVLPAAVVSKTPEEPPVAPAAASTPNATPPNTSA